MDYSITVTFQLPKQLSLSALAVIQPSDSVVVRVHIAFARQSVSRFGHNVSAPVPPIDEAIDRVRECFHLSQSADSHGACLSVADTL